jgi:hypothetical protein
MRSPQLNLFSPSPFKGRDMSLPGAVLSPRGASDNVKIEISCFVLFCKLGGGMTRAILRPRRLGNVNFAIDKYQATKA